MDWKRYRKGRTTTQPIGTRGVISETLHDEVTQIRLSGLVLLRSRFDGAWSMVILNYVKKSI